MTLNTQEQILQSIKKNDKILITFKKNYTTDTVASSIALFHILKKLRKNVDIMAENLEIPSKLNFLPPTDITLPDSQQMNKFIIQVDISKTKLEEFSYDIIGDKLNIYITPQNGKFEEKNVELNNSKFKYDLIFIIDTPDIEQLGSVYSKNTDFFYKTLLINLDHVVQNSQYAQINHVDLTSTSTAEIINDLFFPKNPNLMDEGIATALLTGIISQTRCFKSPQVTPKTLSSVGSLIAAGAKRETIIKNLYRTKSLQTLKIWGKILSNLQIDKQTRHASSFINFQAIPGVTIKEDCLKEVIEELITTSPEADVISLIFQSEPMKFIVLIYSENNINTLDLVKKYKPTGNKNLARLEVRHIPKEQLQKELHSTIQEQLANIPITNKQ